MSFQSTKSLRVQPFAILNPLLATKDLTQDAQEHMPPLLGTPKMEQEQESGFHQDQEKLFQVPAEPQSELLLEVEEMKSQ